jgi:hypothetical protein
MRAAILPVLSIIALSLINHDASSQSRTIKVIVSFPPGGDPAVIGKSRRTGTKAHRVRELLKATVLYRRSIPVLKLERMARMTGC